MKQVVASLEGPIDIEEQELSSEGRPRNSDPEELRLVERLRQGDEAAFASLVDRHHNGLLRLAMAHVSDRSIAEEVVQETWIGVLEGLDRFEGRSSLKTWIFRILTNKAKTRGVRESRHVSFSPLAATDDGADEPAVDPSQFQTTGHWAGYWSSYPQPWDENTPEKLLLSKEGTAFLKQAIEALPAKLQQIIVMRDVEGLSSKEACNILGVSETNQRVLLHRARSKVRRALERYLEGDVAKP
jgi:RNA polymerase sigma-70 factor, ECF subfamily